MWRTHCLRLTRELRSGARNGPVIPRFYSRDVSNTTPISTEEFWESFVAIWPYSKKADAPKIGVAVSGGVDSMALAGLCHRAAEKYDKFPECVGLIVDHKSREGSAEEASWVAEQLRTHAGMSSLILPLQWPNNPTEVTDFETQARKLRYQALGFACRKHGLRSILLGHHADDQAETIMMRIVAGRVRIGLQGIQAVKEIPECYGLHGIHQSGGLDLLPKLTVEERENRPIRIETGGIQIVRPLLHFPKKRLISTCLGMKMPWTEDKTNNDRTLTERNAVRYLFQSHKLPSALRSNSLVNVSRRMQQRVEDVRVLFEGLWRRCKLRLHVQSGVLRVNLKTARSAIDKLASTDKVLAESLATQLVIRLVGLISPLDVIRTGRFDTAVENLFPTFQSTNDSQPLNSFTAGRVCFLPNVPGQPGNDPDHSFEWFLGRQPYGKTTDLPPMLDIPPRNRHPAVMATDRTSAGYQLFDGRFWVRIVNPTDQHVRLRPLGKDNPPYMTRELRKDIKRYAPGCFRQTLPVLTTIDADGRENIIAIPTLGVRFGSGALVGGIRWTIRYKKIEIGNQQVDHSLNRQKWFSMEPSVPRTSKKNVYYEGEIALRSPPT